MHKGRYNRRAGGSGEENLGCGEWPDLVKEIIGKRKRFLQQFFFLITDN